MNSSLDPLKAALEADFQYALTWQANLAMMAIDAGADPAMAQVGAARFMKENFGLNMPFSVVPPPVRGGDE